VPTANFEDWPFTYDDLAPFYYEAECLYGVQGDASDNPFASTRFGKDYPMPPGLGMYFNLLLVEAARQTQFLGEALHPHTFPACINSRFRDGRPPCVDCGPCSGGGCPNNAKGSPAVTALQKALRTSRCQVRVNCRVTRLVNDGGHVTAVQYVDADGQLQEVRADAFVLAASSIESARLCFLSGAAPDQPIGNTSGQVGRNLMFHLQNNVNGFLPRRVHGQRGRAVTHGISDFRGVEPGGEALRVLTVDGQKRVFLGGICEMSASQGRPIVEDGANYTGALGQIAGARFGLSLKNALRDGALGQHLMGLLMQAEDAPQQSNRIDLDPTLKDIFGLPAARVTYGYHAYEKETRKFYVPIMRQVVTNAGTTAQFVTPCDLTLGDAPTSRHVLGTLRMGNDPATSVTRGDGRFHGIDNLYACDGSVFVTSSGYNPTLTLIAVALKIGHGIAGTQPEAC
jgi:gluconate 2-dehydrogenase alpha chain